MKRDQGLEEGVALICKKKKTWVWVQISNTRVMILRLSYQALYRLSWPNSSIYVGQNVCILCRDIQTNSLSVPLSNTNTYLCLPWLELWAVPIATPADCDCQQVGFYTFLSGSDKLYSCMYCIFVCKNVASHVTYAQILNQTSESVKWRFIQSTLGSWHSMLQPHVQQYFVLFNVNTFFFFSFSPGVNLKYNVRLVLSKMPFLYSKVMLIFK